MKEQIPSYSHLYVSECFRHLHITGTQLRPLLPEQRLLVNLVVLGSTDSRVEIHTVSTTRMHNKRHSLPIYLSHMLHQVLQEEAPISALWPADTWTNLGTKELWKCYQQSTCKLPKPASRIRDTVFSPLARRWTLKESACKAHWLHQYPCRTSHWLSVTPTSATCKNPKSCCNKVGVRQGLQSQRNLHKNRDKLHTNMRR